MLKRTSFDVTIWALDILCSWISFAWKTDSKYTFYNFLFLDSDRTKPLGKKSYEI